MPLKNWFHLRFDSVLGVYCIPFKYYTCQTMLSAIHTFSYSCIRTVCRCRLNFSGGNISNSVLNNNRSSDNALSPQVLSDKATHPLASMHGVPFIYTCTDPESSRMMESRKHKNKILTDITGLPLHALQLGILYQRCNVTK